MNKIISFAIFIGAFLMIAAAQSTQAQSPLILTQTESQPLSVTAIGREPFVIQNGETLTGFSIELWEEIARINDWDFEYTVVNSFVDLLRPVREGTTDLAIANISVTADREEVMDFSSSIYTSGLQIMTPLQSTTKQLMQGIGEPIIQSIAITLCLILILCAHVALLARLDANTCRRVITSGHLTKKISKYLSCIGNNIWWILTLGGFGRNLPTSLFGRLSVVLWMFTAVLSLLLTVAHFTSYLTTFKQSDSLTYDDLHSLNVGTTIGSTSETFLREQKITTTSYDDIHELFEDVSIGKLDAVIHDAPLLQYYIATKGKGRAHLSSSIFNPEEFGIALPEKSTLREQINTALLRIQENGTYDEIYSKWFE